MSPIVGLTGQRRLPRLGKIHLGEKVVNARGVEYPRATEHFVVPPEVAAVYGAMPTELDIMFPIEDEEIFASQFYRAYSRTRGLVCKGDGERAARLIDVATKRPEPGTGEVTGDIAGPKAENVEWVDDIPCPGKACPYYAKGDCRELMMLQVILPLVPGLGVWQLDTSSYYGMLNINSGLAMIRQMFGRVSGIPLVLSLEPIEVSPDGKKKTVRVMQLRSRQTLAEIMKLNLPPPQQVALPPPEDEVPELLYPTPEAVKARNDAQKSPSPKKGVSPPKETETIPDVGTLLNRAMALTDADGKRRYPNGDAVRIALGVDAGLKGNAQILAMHKSFDAAWATLVAEAPASQGRTEAVVPPGASTGASEREGKEEMQY